MKVNRALSYMGHFSRDVELLKTSVLDLSCRRLGTLGVVRFNYN